MSRLVSVLTLVVMGGASANFCDLIRADFPSACTCTETSNFDAKMSCSMQVGPGGQTIPEISPNEPFPDLTLEYDMSFDFCSMPATMSFAGSLQLPGTMPQLLEDAINTAVQVVDAVGDVPLSFDESTQTLSVSKTISAGSPMYPVNIPIFYVDVASIDARIELQLSGDLDNFQVSTKVDACIELLGALSALNYIGVSDMMCASELPNCAGNPANGQCAASCSMTSSCTCDWIGKTFPCSDTTGYTDSCSLTDVGVNGERTAAATACALLGDPDVRTERGGPSQPSS
jgi:hypothetical protein